MTLWNKEQLFISKNSNNWSLFQITELVEVYVIAPIQHESWSELEKSEKQIKFIWKQLNCFSSCRVQLTWTGCHHPFKTILQMSAHFVFTSQSDWVKFALLEASVTLFFKYQLPEWISRGVCGLTSTER